MGSAFILVISNNLWVVDQFVLVCPDMPVSVRGGILAPPPDMKIIADRLRKASFDTIRCLVEML